MRPSTPDLPQDHETERDGVADTHPTSAVKPPGVQAPGWIMPMGAVLALLSGGALVVVNRIDSEWALTNSLQLVTSAVAVFVSVSLVTFAKSAPSFLVATGCVVWFAADMMSMAFGAMGIVESHHRYFEVTYLLGQVLWALSAFFALERSVHRSSLWRSADGVLFGLLLVFVMFTLTDVAGAPHAGDSWYVVATVAVDGVYVALALLAARGIGRRFRAGYVAMAASAIVLLATDTVFMYELVQGTALNALITDIGWAAQSAIRIVAVVMIGSLLHRGWLPHEVPLRPSRAVVPLVVAVVGGVVLVEPVSEWEPIRQVLLGLMVAVSVLREGLTWAIIRDLEQSAQAARRDLERKVRLDDLTGVLRRDRLMTELETLLGRAGRAGWDVEVAFVDLNEFSAINDTFGHDIGDRALIEVSRQLKSVGADMVGRMGGDEFVLAQKVESEPIELRERILAALDQPLDLGTGASLRMAASVGVASMLAGSVSSAEALISEADRVAYSVKRGSLRTRAPKKMHVDDLVSLADLGYALEALRADRVVVHFQPIVQLTTRRVAGVEALVRIQGPDGSVRPASTFVPLLQAAGYSADVTATVIRRAVPEFAGSVGPERGWFLTINLTTADVADADTMDLLIDTIGASALRPDQVIVELLPGMDHQAPWREAVSTVRSRGLKVSLDGFGPRSPTFSEVVSFGPAILKVDVAMMPLTERNQHIRAHGARMVEAFVSMAQQQTTIVVARGVEHELQCQVLQRLGCGYAQGRVLGDASILDAAIAADNAARRAHT